VGRNGVLVRTAASLISPGTERASLEFSRMSLLSKARNRPDLVRQVLEKVRRDGFLEAARVVLGRLERPLPIGYACSGIVIAAGPEAFDLTVGDRVACAGTGYANHAEVNYVPRNLTVPVPLRASGVPLSFDEASFATLGAIALHAARLGHPGVGERAAVIGLGLIGLLAGQILRAAGCAVVGIDPNPARCDLGKRLGMEETSTPGRAVECARSFTRGMGADLILVMATSADSGPVHLAGQVARDRATVVAVGATGLEIPRRTYYQKELSFVVARSYGPGRYDPNFEERGQNYPPGYVRWTERENMRAFLDLVAQDRVQVLTLISHRVPIEDALRAYRLLEEPQTLGVILEYPAAAAPVGLVPSASSPQPEPRLASLSDTGMLGVSLIGAGTFAQEVLLPILRRMRGVELRGVVSGRGVSAGWAKDRFGFRFCASEAEAVWEDAGTHAVLIATRHALHGALVCQALKAGKHTFVEKPLCVSQRALLEVEEVLSGSREDIAGPVLMVGFNRRFAPHTLRAREFFTARAGPLAVQYRVNAGRLPADHWMNEPEEGGRVLGEVCHFVDLIGYLVGRRLQRVFALPGGRDTVSICLRYEDGSVGSIQYVGDGPGGFSKERVEIFSEGTVFVIDDFRRAEWLRESRRRRVGWFTQDKGHRAEIAAFVEAARQGAPSPVDPTEAIRTTRATLRIVESLACGLPLEVD
jgi:predicted dehydrogenase